MAGRAGKGCRPFFFGGVGGPTGKKKLKIVLTF